MANQKLAEIEQAGWLNRMGNEVDKLSWRSPQTAGECVSKVARFPKEFGAGN